MEVQSPQKRHLTNIFIHGTPNISKGVRPFIEILETKNLKIAPPAFTNKHYEHHERFRVPESDEIDQARTIELLPKGRYVSLIGDLYLRVRHKGAMSNTTICRAGFHTSFMSDQLVIELDSLDPDSI